MRLSVRDIPRRAAVAAVALALIASIVSGVEGPSTEAAAPAPPQALPAANPAGPAAIPDLDLDKLNRAQERKNVTDLFAARALLPPAPPVLPAATPAMTPPAPVAPPEPTAPALPFRYFGKWIEGDRTVVFLWNNNEGYSAAVGETVAGSYRIESMTDSAIDFTYLPLGSRQTLSIANPN